MRRAPACLFVAGALVYLAGEVAGWTWAALAGLALWIAGAVLAAM
jgi:hypothetical protein